MRAVKRSSPENAGYWQIAVPANPAFAGGTGAKLALPPDPPFANFRRAAEKPEGPVLARGRLARPCPGRLQTNFR